MPEVITIAVMSTMVKVVRSIPLQLLTVIRASCLL
jgi:hypothetical protein